MHIADVSWFINEGSVLDRVASLRATSVYLVHKVCVCCVIQGNYESFLVKERIVGLDWF